MQAWLNQVNETDVGLTLMVVLVTATELGMFMARREARVSGKVPAHASAMQGAVLGLLALLLGFSFSLAMDRFESRKALLRDEANAVATTYLRAQLLPEPMRSAVPPLLRRYLETRIQLMEGFDPARLREVDARSQALLKQMWSLAVDAGRVADTDMTSLFIDALNQTIDMHGLRVASIRNRIPPLLFLLLCAVSAVAMGVSGYASGPERGPARVLNILMALMITLVAVLVFDLHRPTRGLVHVDPAPLVDLRQQLR